MIYNENERKSGFKFNFKTLPAILLIVLTLFIQYDIYFDWMPIAEGVEPLLNQTSVIILISGIGGLFLFSNFELGANFQTYCFTGQFVGLCMVLTSIAQILFTRNHPNWSLMSYGAFFAVSSITLTLIDKFLRE